MLNSTVKMHEAMVTVPLAVEPPASSVNDPTFPTNSPTVSVISSPTSPKSKALPSTNTNTRFARSAAVAGASADITVTSITTEDADGDGSVDRATVVFSEDVDDSTFADADWTVGGATITIDTVSADDDTIRLDIDAANEIAGTGPVAVTYTPGTGADIAGNLLSAVAFAADAVLDGATPLVDTIETADVDGDGEIDRIVVTLSEDVDSPGSDPAAGWTVADFATATGSTLVGNVITLVITESGTVDTDATPDTDYDSGTGDIEDLAATPNVLATVASGDITEDDGASPTGLSAATTTETTIEVTFGEDLDGATVDDGDFAVAGNTVSAATESAAGVVTLTVGTDLAPDATPDVTYTPGTLADPAGNVAASFGPTAAADGLSPSLDSVTWTDVDGSGDVTENDTLVFVFSEALDTTSLATSTVDDDLPISGGGSPSYGSSGVVFLFSVGDTTLTVTVGTPTADIDSGDTVDPAGTVTDVAGNADDTAVAPGIVQVTLSLIPNVTSVLKDATVTVDVAISNVLSFDAAVYTVTFAADRFEFLSAAAGSIGGTPIGVAQSTSTSSTVLLSQNVSGNAGVDGSGNLAVLTFVFIGNSGESGTFTLGTVTLSNNNANSISANLVDSGTISSPSLVGDANGDGSLGAQDITAIERLVIGLDVDGVISGVEPPGADADESGGDLDALDVTSVEELVIAALA